MFYRLGKSIHQWRWFIIVVWLALFATSIAFAPKLLHPFNAIGFTDPTSESAKANQLLNDKLGYSYNRFIVIYKSEILRATQPQFLKEIKYSLQNLDHFPIKHQIIYPDANNKQISRDKHSAYAVVLFKSGEEADHNLLDQFRAIVKTAPHLTMQIGGESIFLDDTKNQTQKDLFSAEYIATPVAIITMLIVFESVVAACLPIVLGGVCALLILFTLFCIAHACSLSVFTINIALLLGLCLSLDYALLIINRFREELKAGHSSKVALAITQATAGKAVFFSGLAVFVSLSALLMFRINVLFSVGMGGVAAVLVAVAIALTLLPAVLAVLKDRINLLPVRILPRSKKKDRFHFWHWIVAKVVKRPFVFFFPILFILLSFGYPFLNSKFGISDFRILPKNLESRQVFETFKTDFSESKLAPILVVVQTPNKSILTKKNISELYDFGQFIKKDPSIEEVNSIVNTTPSLTKDQYVMLYTKGKNHLDPGLKKLLETTTKDNLTVISIFSKYDNNSEINKEFIRELRNKKLGNNMTLQITGPSVNTMDALKSMSHTFPYAFLWIVGFTYLILLILLRSVILPLKAILTTMLSLCASYGLLALVIQQGYLHELLHFEPQGLLDVSLLIIIFCALFGISMDYEVFLLTRIKECYEQTGDTVKSIVFGIERSSKIITSAAIIVILICFSFMSAEVLIVKAFGLGIAVAVFVDAFIIRTILVPATMAILGKLNWYSPKWLNRLLPKVSFDQG